MTADDARAAWYADLEVRGEIRVHEAGHAVVAVLLGLDLLAVRAGGDGGEIEVARGTPRRMAATCLAGIAAEMALGEYAGDGATLADRVLAALEIRRATGRSPGGEALEAFAKRLALWLVASKVIDAVREVAVRLACQEGEVQELTGSEVEEALADVLGGAGAARMKSRTWRKVRGLFEEIFG